MTREAPLPNAAICLSRRRLTAPTPGDSRRSIRSFRCSLSRDRHHVAQNLRDDMSLITPRLVLCQRSCRFRTDGSGRTAVGCAMEPPAYGVIRLGQFTRLVSEWRYGGCLRGWSGRSGGGPRELGHLCCQVFDVSSEFHCGLSVTLPGGHGGGRRRLWVLPVTAGQAAVGTRALATCSATSWSRVPSAVVSSGGALGRSGAMSGRRTWS